ncbi:C4HC3 zinc-finger like motif-containing protein [Senna tora]|uniref:C4HC3 zinc-finger like motif-containing protein n=1 Tax=Senna tora TaxID=362788 RepID=A0A834XLJ5_9FABA|nr:C4HC3 zinc-finger like motif-containing protein [Senna tora]
MSHVDLEQGDHRRSVAGSDVSADDGSLCFTDADDGSCYSHFYSTNGGSSYDDYSFACISDSEVRGVVHDSGRASSVTDCSVEIESGVPEIKVHLAKVERDCRICHLGLESDGHGESGIPIELGCSCKDDLAAAHKHCAEAWFKIKGNRTCEICHSVARNVFGGNEELTEHASENSNIATPAAAATSTFSTPAPSSAETRRFWHGHRFLNFLLACMVFAFVISWLFHFNVPSS